MFASLEGTVALVTGAGGGIGRATVEALRAAGAEVIATDIRMPSCGTLDLVQDVTDEDGWAQLAEVIDERWGRLDCLVNNAALRRETPFAELSFEEWRAVNAIILDGAFLTAKAALSALKQSDCASIINIGGMSAHTGAAHRAHVVAAKSGLVGLTRALAHDLAPQNITVNCVVPGMIDTVRGGSAAAKPNHHAQHQPLIGRRGTPQEIADLVVFLAGSKARYMTGQTIHANGGVFMP